MKQALVVITGATDGIGKVSAREIYKKGYHVVLVGRNADKLQETKKELETHKVDAEVFTEICDLSLTKEVLALGDRIKNKHKSIDVLLNNAGGFFQEREVTPEGIEKTFALNHLSYFLLTLKLLPTLTAGKASRIVNVSSAAHYGSQLDFENVQGEKEYSGWKQYQRSKLMNLYFTYQLAQKIKETPVTVNALHLGFVKTKFGHNNQGLAKTLVTWGQNLFAISEDKGALTSIFLATSPEVNGFSGMFFDQCRSKQSSKVSYEPGPAERLWQISEEFLVK